MFPAPVGEKPLSGPPDHLGRSFHYAWRRKGERPGTIASAAQGSAADPRRCPCWADLQPCVSLDIEGGQAVPGMTRRPRWTSEWGASMLATVRDAFFVRGSPRRVRRNARVGARRRTIATERSPQSLASMAAIIRAQPHTARGKKAAGITPLAVPGDGQAQRRTPTTTMRACSSAARLHPVRRRTSRRPLKESKASAAQAI